MLRGPTHFTVIVNVKRSYTLNVAVFDNVKGSDRLNGFVERVMYGLIVWCAVTVIR